jgi:hypothetical protein
MQEFGIAKPVLDKKYRDLRSVVDSVLDTSAEGLFGELLRARDAAIVAETAKAGADVELSRGTVASLVHMCANRIFPEMARAHEPVLLHLIAKSLRSLAARRNGVHTSPPAAAVAKESLLHSRVRPSGDRTIALGNAASDVP